MADGKRGRRRIPEDLCDVVREDYARTGSHRQTAANTGLSRTSVQNITSGRHLKVKSQSQESKRGLTGGETFSVVPTRCPNGHLVNIRPCRECLSDVFKAVARRDHLRQLEQESILRAQGLLPVQSLASGATRELSAMKPLGVNLTTDQRSRYEEIRRPPNSD